MADKQSIKTPEYPPLDLPVLYSDGILSMSWGKDVVRMYLGRLVPDIHAEGGDKQGVFGQIVMPREGFLASSMFVALQIERMIEAGYVTQEELDKIRQGQLEAAKSHSQSGSNG